MAKRECGTRQAGGAYLCCGVSENGRPIEEFLIDPPIRFDPQELGVTPVGVTLVAMRDVPHVIDWVGSEHYPNVADFVEETRKLGVSRRVPKTFDFAKLTRSSTLMLAHSRAWPHHAKSLLAVAFDVREKWGIDTVHCPQKRPEHGWEIGDPYVCADAWWHDFVMKDATIAGASTPDARLMRTLACERSYFAYAHRESELFKGTPLWSVALFMRVPIITIEVVYDAIGGTHDETYNLAKTAGLPVLVCES